jgi:hypothetical protein
MAVGTGLICREAIGHHGALPRTPVLPRGWGNSHWGHPLAQAGRALPPNPWGRQELALLGLRQTLAAPGEPAVAPRVPDRGDALAPQLIAAEPTACQAAKISVINVPLAADADGQFR